MRRKAEWVSTQKNAVMFMGASGNLVRVECPPLENAVSGSPFCVIDARSAGQAEGLVWLPLEDHVDLYWPGVDVRGNSVREKPDFGEKIFENFGDALDDAFWEAPVATATMHLGGFALNFMDEEKFNSLDSGRKIALMNLALESGVEDNMREQMGYAVDGEMGGEVNAIAFPPKAEAKRKQGGRMK